jgi:hypothetical protein
VDNTDQSGKLLENSAFNRVFLMTTGKLLISRCTFDVDLTRGSTVTDGYG